MRATFNFTCHDCTSFTNTPRTIRPATCNARRLNLRNLFLPWIHWFCLSFLTGRVLRLKLIRLNSHHDRFCTSRCEAKFVVFNKNSKITSCNHITLGQSPCGAPLTLGLLPLQSTLRTVQKNAFFVLKGRSNKNQPAPTSVGANNVRSRGVKYCKGFSNRFSFNPSSVLPSCHKGKFFRNPADRCRGPGIVKERSYSGSQSFRPGLLQPFISCSKERGHLPARDRFEFIKPFCSPRSFSDGGAPLFKDRSQERGPHDKYRSKRRIFFRSPLAPKGSSNPAHTNPEELAVRLQLSSISQSQVSSRANLVAKQFTQGQRQPCLPPTTGSHNSLKCFNARLGCHVSGQDH